MERPFTVMRRSQVSPCCICGRAAVAITGHSSTSQSWKNAPQRRRICKRRSFRCSQSRCVMSTARTAIASALMSSAGRSRLGFAHARQHLLARPAAERRVEQLHVKMERLGRVELRTCGAADLGALAFEEIGERVDMRGDLRIGLLARLARPDGNAQIRQAHRARRRQIRCTAAVSTGSGPAIASSASDRSMRRARQRADHRDVGRRGDRHEGLAAAGAQSPGRLVAEHAAVMRRHADRAADVAAQLQPGEVRLPCAAAPPPDEPPGVCARFHGLDVVPYIGL